MKIEIQPVTPYGEREYKRLLNKMNPVWFTIAKLIGLDPMKDYSDGQVLSEMGHRKTALAATAKAAELFLPSIYGRYGTLDNSNFLKSAVEVAMPFVGMAAGAEFLPAYLISRGVVLFAKSRPVSDKIHDVIDSINPFRKREKAEKDKIEEVNIERQNLSRHYRELSALHLKLLGIEKKLSLPHMRNEAFEGELLELKAEKEKTKSSIMIVEGDIVREKSNLDKSKDELKTLRRDARWDKENDKSWRIQDKLEKRISVKQDGKREESLSDETDLGETAKAIMQLNQEIQSINTDIDRITREELQPILDRLIELHTKYEKVRGPLDEATRDREEAYRLKVAAEQRVAGIGLGDENAVELAVAKQELEMAQRKFQQAEVAERILIQGESGTLFKEIRLQEENRNEIQKRIAELQAKIKTQEAKIKSLDEQLLFA